MKKQNIIPIIALLALVSMMIVPVMAGGTYTGNFSIDFNTYSANTYPDHHCIYMGEINNNQTLIIGNASAYWNSINNGDPNRTLNTPTRNWNLGPDEHWMYSSSYYTQEQNFVVNPTTMQGYGWLVFRPRIVDIDTFAAVWKYVNTEYIPPPPPVNPPTGHVRSTFVTIDGVSYATIHGTNIMLYDVENGSWSNSTSDADGIFYIDTLPYHTINAYATFTIFANHYADASIIGAVTGNSGLDHAIYMWPPGLPPGPGNINLYIPVVDADTTYAIGSVGVQVELPSGAIIGDITGPGGDAAVFVVPNNTIIKARASKTGYGPVTELFNSGEVTPKTKTLSMYRLVVTPVPTATPGPGGTTPVYVDPNDPSLHGGDTSLKAQEMMNWIAMNGMTLVQLCFLACIFGAVGLISKSLR